jgi:glycosyltransferase involved in cell wall biosynthesis
MLVAARRLARFLLVVEPDVVVTKGLFPHFYGALAARKLPIPCIWHVQDFVSERSFGIYRRAFGMAARWLPDQIIVDGAAIARQLPSPIQHRISVIHNGVDSSLFRPDRDGSSVRTELGLPSNAVVIGHVARFTPWKGQHYLLEAFARIVNEAPNAYLLFVGDPVFDTDSYQRRLLQQTARLGIQDRVKFAGYRHDLPDVLAAMDVFAFTSVEKDTSPLALLSAMSTGLPIVAFDIEGVRELIEEDEQLLRVPVRQIESLSTSLLELVSDEELRLRLGRAARQLAERRFTLDRYVTRIERVLAGLTAEGAEEDAEERKGGFPSATSAKTSVSSVVKF